MRNLTQNTDVYKRQGMQIDFRMVGGFLKAEQAAPCLWRVVKMMMTMTSIIYKHAKKCHDDTKE